jgi:hypothetical protein
MSEETLSLRREIERLEKELETQHFRGLFDKKSQDQRLKKLKKLRKQLAALEGTKKKSGKAAKKSAKKKGSEK